MQSICTKWKQSTMSWNIFIIVSVAPNPDSIPLCLCSLAASLNALLNPNNVRLRSAPLSIWHDVWIYAGLENLDGMPLKLCNAAHTHQQICTHQHPHRSRLRAEEHRGWWGHACRGSVCVRACALLGLCACLSVCVCLVWPLLLGGVWV